MSAHPWQWSGEYQRYYRYEERNGKNIRLWHTHLAENSQPPERPATQEPQRKNPKEESPSPWHWSDRHGRYYRRHVQDGERSISWDTVFYTLREGCWIPDEDISKDKLAPSSRGVTQFQGYQYEPTIQQVTYPISRDRRGLAHDRDTALPINEEISSEGDSDDDSDLHNRVYSTDETTSGPDATAYLAPEQAHTDSGYASLDRMKSDHGSNNAEVSSGPHEVDNANMLSQDVQSVVSDDADINSVSSYRTTWIDEEGKTYIAQMLAFDETLNPRCQEALRSMGRPRFIRNVRRILKTYYRNLLHDARTERERICVGLLRSRHGRQRMSQIMAEIIDPEDGQDDVSHERLIQHRKDPETIDAWIKVLPTTYHVDPGSTDLVSEPQALHGPVIAPLSDSSESSDDDDVIEFPSLDGMKRFFCESYSFRVLFNEISVLHLPSQVRDIALSTQKERLWFSRNQDDTLLNQVKSFVEDFTHLPWNWWPLQPRLKRLKQDEVRLFTKCSCGTVVWTETTVAIAESLEEALPKLDPHGLRQPRCRTQYSYYQWLGYLCQCVYTAIPSRSSQRYTPPNDTPITTQIGQASQLSANNQQRTTAQQQYQNQRAFLSIDAGRMTSPAQFLALPKYWILLGVKGPRPSLEISQIPIDQNTDDSSFYRALKNEYRKNRGRMRLWLSFWRLGYCEVVKFKRIAPQWVIKDRKDMPEQVEYVYAPRPPIADNPPISQHEFEMHLNACSKPCRWHLFHYCMPELHTTSTIQRIPKKDNIHAFDNPSGDDKYVYAWGLEATHVISALHILIYHFLIFVVPFGFWGWWISRHPDDLQGATVPATFVLGLLSLFWSMNGILTEGRHGTKGAQG